MTCDRLIIKTFINGSQLAKQEKVYSLHVPATKMYKVEAIGLCKSASYNSAQAA